jgi:hypothetical protein
MVLLGLAVLVGLLGFLWLTVVSFRESLLWGLVVLLLPLGNLVFICTHWSVSKRAFQLHLASLLLAGGAMFFLIQTGAAKEAFAFTSTLHPPEAALSGNAAPGTIDPATMSLDEVQTALRELTPLESELRERKAKTGTSNPAELARLKTDIAAYNAKLQPLLARKVSLVGSTPAATATAGKKSGASSPKWVSDATAADIPDAPASGSVRGANFTMKEVALDGDRLALRSGKEFFADAEVQIFLFESNGGAKLANRSYLVDAGATGSHPHVHLSRLFEKGGVPKTEIYMNRYTMRLEFGAAAGGKLLGRIYLCFPDNERSFVAGSFAARIE